MRKYTPLLIFLLLLSLGSRAQVFPPNQPEQDPCTPMLLCGGGTTTSASFQGVGDSTWLTHLNPGCLQNGFQNFTDVFFWEVDIATTGLFAFTLTPTNPCMDYDWIVYKINPNLPCPESLDSAVIMRCNSNDIYSSQPLGQTGLSTLYTTPPTPTSVGPGAGQAFLAAIPATAGDVYLVAINNAGTYGCPFGTIPCPVNISFDSSTSLFQDSIHPAMEYIIPSCNEAEKIEIHMNKPILCDSIAADGSDFTINGSVPIASATGVNCGPGGLTQNVLVTFASALPAGNYVIHAVVGSDGNTLLDACDTALVPPDSLLLTINPYTPLGFAAASTPPCSEIHIAMNARIRCDSIAGDGSDFQVTGPQPVVVQGAYGTGCDSNGFTDSVVLLLQHPIQTDGTYTVKAVQGTDGNTQVDSCGEHQAIGNSVTFNINSFDHKITASPHDTVLCHQGYMYLNATTNVPMPPVPPLCGTQGAPCNSAIRHIAYGKDSLSTDNSPFYSYGKSREQFIYTAKELRLSGMKPGAIQAIGWNVIQHNVFAPFISYSIKLGCTNATMINQGFLNGLQEVYTNAAYTTTPGWNMFTLSTPFNWDGESNIVVEVCQDNISSNSAADEIEHAVTDYPSVYHLYDSQTTSSGCGITLGGTTVDAGNYHLRPKTRFDICPTPQGNVTDRKYAWTPSAYLSDTTISHPLGYVVNTTRYTVMTVDYDGCAHRDTAHVTVSKRNPYLIPNTDTSFCIGHTATYLAGGGVHYQWYSDQMAALSCATCNNPVITPDYSSRFHVIISDKYNCADTLSDSITVFQLPIVEAFPHDTIVNYGASVQLDAAGAKDYIWTPSQALSPTSYIRNPIALVTDPIVYTVYGIDSNGCHSTDSVHINVNYRAPIFVPSAFTPNNDGKNDLFRVVGITYQKVIEFRVFNRWGQEIYNTTTNQGWDGTWNGVAQDNGTYDYIIRVVYPDGYMQTLKGSVTLLR